MKLSFSIDLPEPDFRLLLSLAEQRGLSAIQFLMVATEDYLKAHPSESFSKAPLRQMLVNAVRYSIMQQMFPDDYIQANYLTASKNP